MPVDRTLAEGLADGLVDLYREAEQSIISDLARRFRDGIDRPTWAADKLGSINDLRNATQRLIRVLDGDTTGKVEQAVVLAFARGGEAALDELMRLGGLDPRQLAAIRTATPGAEAINRLIFSLVSKLRGTHLRILRWPLDVYRDVIAAVLPQTLLGTTTRLAAAQHAYDRFVSAGVTGFVDKAGRNWQLSTYVEMAVRTGTAQAAVEGHLDRLGAAGVDLIVVSDAVQECERCRPWEGQVLARTGPSGRRTVEREHATVDGRTVEVKVRGSVDEAIAKGLLHPNCRHSLFAYLPGITRTPTHTADPDGDKARQQQRAIEREIRAAKLQQLGALTPEARTAADRKVRDKQAKLRDHLADHPELKRLRYREQIGAGNLPPAQARTKTPPPPPPPPTPKPKPQPARPPVVARPAIEVDPQTGPRIDDLVPTGRPDETQVAAIQEAIRAWLSRDFGGLTVKPEGIGPSRNFVTISGKILTANGDKAGNFTRILMRGGGDLSVEHSYLYLYPQHQGQGFAKAFNGFLYDWYRASGVKYVKVHANIDVGGYTWATQGFDFEDAGSAEGILERLQDEVESVQEAIRSTRGRTKAARPGDQELAAVEASLDRSQAQVDAARHILARADEHRFGTDHYPSAFEISQCGRYEGAKEWIGRRVMLDSDWYGVRWL
ncbi:phage minor capsid protein [Actinokineospora sp.]|uniref:phage minor capsid protein n=1 Tax=Actinokineospora sp. TaxID=1872133 RepID=UPI003D6B6D39